MHKYILILNLILTILGCQVLHSFSLWVREQLLSTPYESFISFLKALNSTLSHLLFSEGMHYTIPLKYSQPIFTGNTCEFVRGKNIPLSDISITYFCLALLFFLIVIRCQTPCNFSDPQVGNTYIETKILRYKTKFLTFKECANLDNILIISKIYFLHS